MTKLVQELMEHDIPSYGPQTGMLFVRIRDAIDSVPDPSDEMLAFKRCLNVMIKVGLEWNGAVIAKLGELIKASK